SAARYYSCWYNINNTIAFHTENRLTACCIAAESRELDICNIDTLDDNCSGLIENIKNKKRQIKESFQRQEPSKICKSRYKIKKANVVKQNKTVKRIMFAHYMACNLKCAGCYFAQSDKKYKDTDHKTVVKVIKHLEENHYLDKDVIFEVGSGEPSISKGMQSILEYIFEHNYKALVNTNCAQYIELWAKAAEKGLFQLQLDVDAGSREVYTKIKGADYFDIVWKNVGKYINATSKGVNVKFILFDNNLSDIKNMVDKCVENKVRTVVINQDAAILKEKRAMPIKEIRFFKQLLKQNNIEAQKGPHIPKEVWEYDN
ncbi:MAG: radical SAM protein, partial [Elusimicrobiota bacterium]|nr:radical SAM protein [Elusimicrobiota bacterium]